MRASVIDAAEVSQAEVDSQPAWDRRATQNMKGHAMWALVLFTFATSGAATGTVTTLEFQTQQLCLIAVREIDSTTKPLITTGLARYNVIGTCVQTGEATKK